MDTPSKPSPTSLKAPITFTGHSRYCAIYTPLGKFCLKEFPMSLDWDDNKEEDQVKGGDKDKGNDQKTLKPPTPFITDYFGKMSSATPIMDALEEECRCNTIMSKEKHVVQNQDTLEDIN